VRDEQQGKPHAENE